MHWPVIRLAPVVLSLFATSLQAENRSIDGSGNNLSIPTFGAANRPFIRFGYGAQFFGPDSALPSELHRANARTISNAVFAQSASRPSAR